MISHPTHYLIRRNALAYFPPMRGEQVPTSKLTEADVREIHRLGSRCRAIRGGKRRRLSTEELAERFDVTPVHVNSILRGKAWSHIYDEIYGAVSNSQ